MKKVNKLGPALLDEIPNPRPTYQPEQLAEFISPKRPHY